MVCKIDRYRVSCFRYRVSCFRYRVPVLCKYRNVSLAKFINKKIKSRYLIYCLNSIRDRRDCNAMYKKSLTKLHIITLVKVI